MNRRGFLGALTVMAVAAKLNFTPVQAAAKSKPKPRETHKVMAWSGGGAMFMGGGHNDDESNRLSIVETN